MIRLIITTILCVTINFCFGQTQGEMNENASKNYRKADQELNVTYQKILEKYKEDNAFIKNFKIAQRLWIQFRDAEMKAKYPDRAIGYYGSVQPMCWYLYLETLTEDRTKKIKVWLTGIEEGDACAGSVKIKN